LSFFGFGLSQGQIVPELIMAENKDPLRLTGFLSLQETEGKEEQQKKRKNWRIGWKEKKKIP